MADGYEITRVYFTKGDALSEIDIHCLLENTHDYEDWSVRKLYWVRKAEYTPDGEIKTKRDTKIDIDFDGNEEASNFYMDIINALKSGRFVWVNGTCVID